MFLNYSEKLFYFGLGLIVGFIITYLLILDIKQHTRPVEENIATADSIIKVNDSIKIKVEQLDSIKNAKVIEVQTLDNDSSIKLFYELISK